MAARLAASVMADPVTSDPVKRVPEELEFQRLQTAESVRVHAAVPSRHTVWLGGRLVLGPWSGEGASGWVPWALLAAVRCAGGGGWGGVYAFMGAGRVPCSALFGLFEWQGLAGGLWARRLCMLLYASGCALVRRVAADDPGILPR
jgi:hypothetical protein